MSKNTKRMGIIPRGYGLALNHGNKTVVYPPSRFAEGYVMILTEKEIKELWRKSNYEYQKLKERVKKIHGSYNLLSNLGLKYSTAGGTTTINIVKSRSHGGRKGKNGFRNPVVYNVSIKGIQTLDDKISYLTDFSCGCGDFVSSKILDESKEFSIACAHIAAVIQAYQTRRDNAKYCKPLREGEIASPYDFSKNEDLIVKYLEMRYIQGKKLFEIDVELLKEDRIITKEFKKGIEEGYVTFNCIKDCENYTPTTKRYMYLYSKVLRRYGERTGIALEDGQCVWNYKINDNLDVRLIPYDRGVKVERVVYDENFIDRVSKSDPFVRYYYHFPPSVDPMRRKKRIFAIDDNLDVSELERLISTDY